MERHFDASLRELKEQLVSMAGLVELAIEAATEALQKRDREKIALVHDIERRVNAAHIAVDNSCVKLLALQQPLAADLRLIVATIKINTDLERMGDQAVNIAHNTERYIQGEPLKPLIDLPRMFDEVRVMVRETLDSFVRTDAALAREVLRRDDIVDGLKNKIFRDVLDHVKARPEHIEQGLNLILVARNLERIGDHATNIAEDVIFAITGEDIRHSARVETIKGALT
ncbi:MAG: phosphate signaling complex protein PhoU [Deltaproteobacteria bacterium]|nr:phosphate signaling complex protein PhoU [Deltaproteobacteria bacterium]